MAKKVKPSVRKHLIVGVVPGTIIFRKRSFDLANLTPEEVVYLIDNGCAYIKWEEQEQEASPPEESAKND